jgi:hypothetical protein
MHLHTEQLSQLIRSKNLIAQSLFSKTLILQSSFKPKGHLFSKKFIKIFPFPPTPWNLLNILGFTNHLSDEFLLLSRPKKHHSHFYSFSTYFHEQPAFYFNLLIDDSIVYTVKINTAIIPQFSHEIIITDNIYNSTLKHKTRLYQKLLNSETLKIEIPSPFQMTSDPIGCLACLVFTKFQTPAFTALYKYFILHSSTDEKELFKDIPCFAHVFQTRNDNYFNNFNGILNQFGGKWYLDYIIEHTTSFNLPTFSDDNQSGFIKSLVFIPDEAYSIICFDRINCIQLDGTFKFFRPYVLSIPLAIINNSYIPLGFSIGPSENLELFSNFYDEVIINSGSQIAKIPVLSDRGTAIEALCASFNIPHYYCITHLLRLLGGHNRFLFLFKKLLNTTSEDDVFQFLEYINILLLEINDRTELELYLEKIGLSINDENKIIENGILFRQCCFAFRIHLGIPKTTNSLESLHSHINELKSRHNNFWYLVYALIQLFQERYLNLTEGVVHNYQHALSNISKSKAKLTQNTMEREKILYQTTPLNCNCDQHRKFSALFGIAVPCRHQLALGVLLEDVSSHFKCTFSIPNITKSVIFNVSNEIRFTGKFKKSNKLVLPDNEIQLDIFPENFKDVNPKNIIFEAICHRVRLNSIKIELIDFHSVTWDNYYHGAYHDLIGGISSNPVLATAVTN